MSPVTLVKAATILALLSVTACISTPSRSFRPSPAEERLVSLMSRRLSLAREVAWIKYCDGLPVRDPRREAELLARLSTAPAQHTRPGQISGSEFISAQIVASRRLQEAEIEKWTRGAALPAMEPRPLVPTVRGDIEKVTAEMAALLPSIERSDALASFAHARLRSEHLPMSVASEAARPLAD